MTIRAQSVVLLTLICLAAATHAADPSRPGGGNLQNPDVGPNHPAARAAEVQAKAMRELEDELRVRLDAAEQELRKTREMMRAVNGGRPVEGLRDTLASIQQDSTRLRIDLAGAEARKTAIEKSMALVREQAAQKAAADPVSDQLKELVKLLEMSRQEQQKLAKSALASNAEVRRADIEIAEAKVKLLERQQSMMQQAGGADVSKLADQLTAVSAQLVETQARLKAMEEMLTIFDKLQRLMEQEQDWLWQVNKLRGMLEHVERVKLDRQLGIGSGADPGR